MSFLTDEEAGALAVRRLILHVVGDDALPFAPEHEISDLSSGPFFQSRIKAVASASVHEFKPGSATKATLERMAQEPKYFVEGAQNLAREFSRLHVESSVSGAFFVLELTTSVPGTLIYALMKYDYSPALELTERQGQGPELRNIVHAFVTEKRAIQKSCLIRVVGAIAQDAVSAVDRMGRGSDITDYFAKFLEVARSRSDDQLNMDLKKLVHKTLTATLPKEEVLPAFQVAIKALRSRSMITEEAIREALFLGSGSPTDETALALLEKETDRSLAQEKLSGVEFRPSASILATMPKRRLQTVEGVQVSYPGEEEGSAVELTREGKGWRIVVTTDEDLVTNENLVIKSS